MLRGIGASLIAAKTWTVMLARAGFEKRQRAFVHATAAIAVESLSEWTFSLSRCQSKQRHRRTELDVVRRAENCMEGSLPGRKHRLGAEHQSRAEHRMGEIGLCFCE